MKKLFLLSALSWMCAMEATPSSVFWTVCTTDVYATGTGHIDEDNFFSVFKRRGRNCSFLPDTGLEIGAFSWKQFEAELGFDYIGGSDDPLYFNIGIAAKEGMLFPHAPSFKLGFFNAGTRYHGEHRTNQNVFDVIIGKTLPDFIGGRFFVGAYRGNKALGKVQSGFMVAFQRPFCPAIYCDGKEYFRWVFCADYASGKNRIGGGGVGIYYFFTPDISILTGPTWFNSRVLNGDWKWSVQIGISFAMFDPKCARW